MKQDLRIARQYGRCVTLTCGAAFLFVLASTEAMAQNTNALQAIPVTPPPSRFDVTQPAATLSGPTDKTCAKLITLKYPGFETPLFPPPCDTIDADWKFRKTLYDYGFLTSAQIAQRGGYDVLGHNRPNAQYGGEDITNSETLYGEIVYDLSRIGLPKGSLFSFAADLQRGNYSGYGPNAGGISELGAWIPLFHDRVEVQVGYEEWQNMFYGSNFGTSAAASALGPFSGLQTQLGMANFVVTPGIDVRIWAPDHHFYNHFGVSRSAAPDGAYADDTARGPGVEAIVPGTGGLFIDEVGYRIPRGPDEHYFWLRAGAIYNNSEFGNFNHNNMKTRGNQGFYFTGDYQLIKTDREVFARGLYVNFKLDAAPPDRNLFADDAALSFYDIGPFNSRPHDVTSIGFTYDRLSGSATKFFESFGAGPAPRWSTTLIGSYVFHVQRGIFLIGALSWVRNPNAGNESPHNAFETLYAINFLL